MRQDILRGLAQEALIHLEKVDTMATVRVETKKNQRALERHLAAIKRALFKMIDC